MVEEEVTEVVGFLDNYEVWRIRKRELMKYEQNRLHSFTPELFDVSVAQRLPKAGFYCLYGGATKCFSCGLYKHSSFWQEGYDPETVHREERPDCKFITGHSDNVPIPEMKYEQNRRDSFNPDWLDFYQLDVSVAQRLAKAGFYRFSCYTHCFWCGLYKHWTFWRNGNDPETVHREESPNCEFVTGQSGNVPIDVKQKNKIKFVSQSSLPSVKDKTQNPMKIDTGPTKEQIQSERKINDKGTKRNQSRETEQRTKEERKLKRQTPNKGQIEPERKINDKDIKTKQNKTTEERTVSGTETAERKPGWKKRVSGLKQPVPEKPAVITSTSSTVDTYANHAAQNVHQGSATVTGSGSTAVSREKFISRRDTGVITSKTHQGVQTKDASRFVEEKGVGATRYGSSDDKTEKSANSSIIQWEHFMSEPTRNVTHTDKSENVTVTQYDDFLVRRVKQETTRQEHFTSEIPCSIVSSNMTFKS